tara:strand:+ start:30782 stop:34087 length:3306 start_codon:yes stop_codon:yes gene_type:complete
MSVQEQVFQSNGTLHTLALTFDTTLNNNDLSVGDFMIKEGNQVIDISSVDISNTKLTFTLKSTLDTVNSVVIYSKNIREPTKLLKTTGKVEIENFSFPSSKFELSARQPLGLSHLDTSGSDYRFILNFNGKLKNGIDVSSNDFKVFSNKVEKTVSLVEISNNNLMITSQTGTNDVNTLDIRYTLNSDISHNMIDLNDKTINAFSFPFDSVVSGFYLNDGELKIVYENQLDNTIVPDKNDFVLKQVNDVIDISSVTIDNGDLKIIPSTTIENVLSLKLNYVRDNSNILIDTKGVFIQPGEKTSSLNEINEKIIDLDIVSVPSYINKLQFKLQSKLNPSQTLNKNHYTLNVDNSNVDISFVEVYNGDLFVTPVINVPQNSDVFFKYTPPRNRAEQLISTMNKRFKQLQYPDNLGSSLSLDGSYNVVLTFTNNLQANSNIDKADFILKINNTVVDISSVSIDTNKITAISVVGIESVNDIDIIYKLHPNKAQQVKDARGLVIKSFGRSGYVNKILSNASQYNHGITNEDMSSRVNLAIPDYISKNSNNKYVLSNIEHGVNNTEVLINDAGSLKRRRTNLYVKKVLKRLKQVKGEFSTKSGDLTIKKGLLSFPLNFKKYVNNDVTVFDSGSLVNTDNLSRDESYYTPLDNDESVTYKINSKNYTFTKKPGKTIIIPSLQNISEMADGEILTLATVKLMFGSLIVSNNPDSVTVHLPFVFDVCGNITIFGELAKTGDLYNYQHEFTAGGIGANLTASKLSNAFFYQDEVQRIVVSHGTNLEMNGSSARILELSRGVKYRFDVSDTTMIGSYLAFSSTPNGFHNNGVDLSGIEYHGTPGNKDAYVLVTIANNTPSLIYSYNRNAIGSGQFGKGNKINVIDKVPMFYRGSQTDVDNLKESLHKDLCVDGEAAVKHVIDPSSSKVMMRGEVKYNYEITEVNGNSLGETLLRYVSTHLSGHPLGQAIIKNDGSFKNNVNGKQNEGGADIANVLINTIVGNMVENADHAISNNVLQSLFEQMTASDITRFGGIDNVKRSLPFEPNDKLILYITMKANLFSDENVVTSNVPNNAAKMKIRDVFTPDLYPYLNYVGDSALLNAGTWKIVFTLS